MEGFVLRQLVRLSIVLVSVIVGNVVQYSEAGETKDAASSYASDLVQVFDKEHVKAAIQEIRKGLSLEVKDWNDKDSVLCVRAEISAGVGHPKYTGLLTYATALEYVHVEMLGGYPAYIASPSGGLMFDFDTGRYNDTSFHNPEKGIASIVISTGIAAFFSTKSSDAEDDKGIARKSQVDIDLSKYLDWPTLPETVVCIGTEKRRQIIATGKHEGKKRWSWLLVDKDLRFPIYQAGAHTEGIGGELGFELLLNITVRDKSSIGPIPSLSPDILKAIGIKSEALPQKLWGKRLYPYDESVMTDPRKFESLKKACSQAPLLRLMSPCGIEVLAAPVKSSERKSGGVPEK